MKKKSLEGATVGSTQVGTPPVKQGWAPTAAATVTATVHNQLSVFTRDGKTFTFKYISGVSLNEYTLTFDYVAMSDGKMKRGTFFVQNMAGYTVT